MKLIGSISKEMFYKQTTKFISYTDLQMYQVPLQGIATCDIGRLIYLNEETGEITLEKYSKKGIRTAKTFILESDEQKPTIDSELPH